MKASDVHNDLLKWDAQIRKIEEAINNIESNDETCIPIARLNSAVDTIKRKHNIIQSVSERVANVFFETMKQK